MLPWNLDNKYQREKKIILVGISISQDFKCMVQMLISIAIDNAEADD